MSKFKFLALSVVMTLCFCALADADASAQGTKDGYVVGIVRDRVTDEPLIGVAIYFDGQSYGSLTNEDGYYSIKRPNGGGTLIFSLIGYETVKVKIGSHAKMDVTLVEATESLDDVIVTGFAPIRKDGFSGNTTKIKKDEILKANPTNMISAIQTFDPSFRIQQNIAAGANPNAAPEISLRGQTSISGTSLETQDISKQSLSGTANMPIFILDGFEVDVEKIYDLDPTRIHSINILKDAAATRDAMVEQAQHKALEESARLISDARAEIESEKQAAIGEIRKQVAVLSVSIAEKVVRGSLADDKSQMDLIDRMLDEVSSSDNK